MFPLSVQCAWERVQNDPHIVMVLAHFLKVMVGSRTACHIDVSSRVIVCIVDQVYNSRSMINFIY